MTKFNLFALYILILLFALFTIIIMGFIFAQKSHQQDITTVRLISTVELKENLERSLSLNKRYSESTNFARRIKNIIIPIAKDIKLHTIAFIDNSQNNRVLYSYSTDSKFQLSGELPKIFTNTHDSYHLIDYKNLKWIKVNLYKNNRRDDFESAHVGAFIMGFPKDVFALSLSQFMLSNLKSFFSILFISSLIFVFIIFKSPLKLISADGRHTHNKKIMLGIIFISQALFTILIMLNLFNLYINSTQEIVQDTAMVQAKSMNRIFNLGLPLSIYENSEKFIHAKIGLTDDIYSFKIIDSDGKVISNTILGGEMHNHPPARVELKSKNKILGYIEASINSASIKDYIFSCIPYIVGVLICSFLLNLVIIRIYQRSLFRV